MKTINALFPGQGSQCIGMGQDLYRELDHCKEKFAIASDYLKTDLANLCFNGPEDQLNQTQYTQSAIFIVSATLFDELHAMPLDICSVAGHSLGEITAYYASGVIDFNTALTIVIQRGRLMGDAAKKQPGEMAAIVGISSADIQSIISPLSDIVIANYNSPVQSVISGTATSVQTACQMLSDAGAKRVIPLPVSGAFHSQLMAPAVQAFHDFLTPISFEDAVIPILLNRTAQQETRASVLKDNLPKQIQSSVQWVKIIEHMQDSCNLFVEIGPGRVLSGLTKKINRSNHIQSVSDMSTLQTIQTLLED